MYEINRGSKCHVLPYGLVVRIRGFHPRGPGSIPGMGNIVFKLKSIGSVNDIPPSRRHTFWKGIVCFNFRSFDENETRYYNISVISIGHIELVTISIQIRSGQMSNLIFTDLK